VVTGTAAGKAGGAGKFTIGRSIVNVVEPLSTTIWIVTLTNVPRSGTFWPLTLNSMSCARCINANWQAERTGRTGRLHDFAYRV
jgi:hypothetical protein